MIYITIWASTLEVAKYKGLAKEREMELKLLRSDHVALAHQETRQLAYEICTGNDRLNSNSAARLHLGVTGAGKTTSAERHMLRRPSIGEAEGGRSAVGDLNAGLRQVTRGNQSQRGEGRRGWCGARCPQRGGRHGRYMRRCKHRARWP